MSSHTSALHDMTLYVTENTAQRRFEMVAPNDSMAATYYRINENGYLVLIHTDLPENFDGQSVHNCFAIKLFELIRQTGRKTIVKCPFLFGFLQSHPEYATLVAD